MPEKLYIVSCTRKKFWSLLEPMAAKYLPAEMAYVGSSFLRWRMQAAGKTWVILSAKYGFIEPEHPIADYDMSFGDRLPGPISIESLRGQVYQERPIGKLADYKTIILINCGPEYVLRIRHAFSGTGAKIKE